ncbi:hypothetical protein ACH0DZ_002563 [Enterococcus hirae]|uniref:hypothetical protein n=1 Tax=Enterococcus sp. C51 TaxID=3231312 RepID=UPI002E9F15F1|nr:hypothetical protein [Enterococcus hirae]
MTLFSYEEFLEITEAMKAGEYIKFQLLIVEGEPIYQGTYHKKKHLQTFEEDLEEKLDLLVKNKSITELKKDEIWQSIHDEPIFEADTSNLKSSSKVIRRKYPKISFPKLKKVEFHSEKMRPMLKRIGLIFLFFFLVLGIGIGVKNTLFNTDKSNQNIVSGDHFNKETEITLDNYLEIAEKVPSRQEEIADFLAQNHAFKKLEEYETRYPTEIGAFELAFNHQEWEKVVKADVSHLTDERKMMLAIAFLELGNKKEAELINKQIQSKTLSKKIAIAYLQDQNIQAAKEIQNQLKDKNLEELIDTASIYKEMVDYYKAEKDTTNQEIWERKFKNLGIEESESS